MARVSYWSRLRAVEARVPRADPNPIRGIVHRILGTGPNTLNLISGIFYKSCLGYEHPLDGQSIDFGEPGVPIEEVPSPWRELLEENSAPPFTFDLDHAPQD